MELTIEYAGYVLAVVLAIVPIANPFSTAPIFVALTANANTRERHKTATQACLYMAVLLIVILLIGTL